MVMLMIKLVMMKMPIVMLMTKMIGVGRCKDEWVCTRQVEMFRSTQSGKSNWRSISFGNQNCIDAHR